MLLATTVQAVARFPSVATIGTAFGGIPRSLPGPSLPEITMAQGLLLVGPAFTIAMLGAIESLLTAVMADGMTGNRHDSNQELVGQGIANIFAPLFGGFAATGAIARTATNIRNGAVSPVAGIVHGVFLVLVIVLLAPWAAAIPLSALAAILFTVAWNMSDAPHCIRMLRRAATPDRLLLVVTFLLTVFVDLVVGVGVGVVFAALLFMQRMSDSVSLQEQLFTGDSSDRPPESVVALPPNALVYRIEGPMFFAAAEKLERVLERTPLGVTIVVLRFGAVPFLDATGVQMLAGVIQRFRKRRVRVLLCGVRSNVAETLRSGEIFELIGEENVCNAMRDISRLLGADAPIEVSGP